MIIFPNISPVAFEIGPLAIHWYGLGYIVGLALGWGFARLLVVNNSVWSKDISSTSPIGKTDIDDIMTWLIVGIIFGGRLGYVLFYNFTFYLSNPLAIFAIWDGGMSFHGGLIGAILAIIIFSLKRKFSPLSMLDINAVSCCFGIFLVRITNFINSELWGKTTTLPWGVVFPNGGPLPRHPSQLYEAGLEGLLMFAILCLLIFKYKKLHHAGFITGAALCIYATFRILIEFVREPDAHIGYLFGNFLTTGMILCLPMILLGFWFMKNANKNTNMRTAK